jgi:hypothetical protein
MNFLFLPAAQPDGIVTMTGNMSIAVSAIEAGSLT